MNVNNANKRQDNHPLLLPSQRQQQQQEKKCRGNRRNQRFRRKCRTQGMKPGKIEKLLAKRNENNNTRNTTTDVNKQIKVSNKVSTVQKNNHPSEQMTEMAATTVTTNLNKRKRDISVQELNTNSAAIPKSTSAIPILQPSLKKMKNQKKIMKNKKKIMIIPLKKITNTIIQQNYRRPIYLKRSSLTLFQTLNKTLNYTFKKKDEQKFIYIRLNVLDQQYCLEVDQQLWQSYFDIGLQQHRWPDQLYKMAKTNNPQLCQQYLKNYIENIKKQMNQCEIELTKQQSQLCPITTLSFNQIDYCLKQYVDCQRKYLKIRSKDQLNKFKDNNIYEKDLFKTIPIPIINQQQKEIIHRLMTIRQQQGEIWKELLQFRMRILYKLLPLTFDHFEHFLRPIHYSPLNNKRKGIELRNKGDKYIQEAKRIWLDIYLNTYITKIQAYDQQYRHEFIQLESQIMKSTTTTNDYTSSSLIKKIKDYVTDQTNKLKENIYNQMSSFRKKLLQKRQHLSSRKNMIGVSPEPYLDLIANQFSKRQWNYLSYGPSMIRLNQSATRSRQQQEAEIAKLHKEIFNKVQCHLIAQPYNMSITNPSFKRYSDQLLNYLNHCYFTPLPYKDQIEAEEQAQVVASIRKTVETQKLIIRLTDKSNNFYIGSRADFEEKVQKYFADTNAFIELSNNPLKEMIDKVWHFLHQLETDKLIFPKHCKKMLPDRAKVELSHLYFNPKTHKDNIPVRPIENTIHSVTKNISDFLDQLIRPIFDEKCETTTIINGTSLIKGLEEYTKKGLLKPSTLFCTFDIRKLYTMLPQDEALNTLMEFLHAHGYTKVDGIALDTIRKLASIVLKENVFAYGNKIYRQIIGGAMGSSFTLTLANIYMWKWQKEFVRQQDISGEYFGRYIDDTFMTWNRSQKTLRALLENANTWDKHIQLDYKIGKILPFLDVLLTNQNGNLSTSVYHKPAAEPYVVPFFSDHPRHVFGNIIQTALARAVRYSSTFQAYQNEQRYIELMLLYNGYPSSFIDNQFRTFSSEYIPSSSFLSYIDDEKQYFLLRNKFTLQTTARPSKPTMDNTTNQIGHEQTEDRTKIQPRPPPKKATDPVEKYEYKLVIHYTHEKRFKSFKRDMHKLYGDIFGNPSTMNVKIMVGNHNRRCATHELIRKRPKKALLKDRSIKTRPRKPKRVSTSNKTSNPT